MKKEILNLIWGKTKKINNKTIFQPVIYHLINAGVVAQGLWRQLPQKTRIKISQQKNMTEEEMMRTIGYITSLHDIGKASPGFQAKQEEAKNNLQKYDFQFPEICEAAHNITGANV